MTVLPANIWDSAGAKPLIQQIVDEHERLEKLWADPTYPGGLVDWANGFAPFDLEIVKRRAAADGFVLLPRRWIVERTFAQADVELVREYRPFTYQKFYAAWDGSAEYLVPNFKILNAPSGLTFLAFHRVPNGGTAGALAPGAPAKTAR